MEVKISEVNYLDLWRPILQLKYLNIYQQIITSMDTPPNSTAVMKVSYDGVLPTGHRLKGPPTMPDRGHPEDTGLNSRTQNEDGSSACRPPYELAASKEGLATPVPHSTA